MNLQEYLDRQQTSLLNALRHHTTSFAAASDLEKLKERVAWGEGTVEPIGRFRNAVCVISKHGDRDLWCRAQAQGYTDAFIRFAREQYGFVFDRKLYPDYQVDHLFNRGRARKGSEPAPTDPLEFTNALPSTAMVRMVLVRSDVNQSFGSLLEKRLVQKGDGRRPYRDFTSMQLAKALSIHPNITGDGLMSTSNLLHIVQELDQMGVLKALDATPALMLSELLNQRDHAAG